MPLRQTSSGFFTIHLLNVGLVGPETRHSMMKKTSLAKTAEVNSRHVAALLLVGGVVGLTSLSAGAQTPPAPTQATPQLAMTKPAQPAASADPATPRAQAFETAPSLRTSPLALGQGAPQISAEGAAALNEMAKQAVEENVTWVLDSDSRPWALSFQEPPPLNALVLTLPSDREARIQLPGAAADMADRARMVVSRYITDNIGSAAQARGRQLEAFNMWAANTTRQKKLLAKDPWVAYQFNREALEAVTAFKARVNSQTAPGLERMADDVRRVVSEVSTVMNATGGYDQKMQWYNVLVQLKEGVSLYQTRVVDADRAILDAIAGFEQDNPPVARPAGNPPPRKQEGMVSGGAATAAPNAAMTPEGVVQREKAQPVKKEEAPSQTGGLIVIAGMAAVVFGLFLKLRRRVAKKAAAPESSKNS